MPDREQTVEAYGLSRRWMTICLLCLSAFFAVLVIISSSDKGTIATCALSAAALAVFWPLVSSAQNMKFGISGFELSKKVEEAKQEANGANDKAEKALATLGRFVFNSMPQPIFRNLIKINEDFGPFDMTEDFKRQLRLLRDSGYITTHNIAIGQIPNSGKDLSNYVYTTPLGKEFILQRNASEQGLAEKINLPITKNE